MKKKAKQILWFHLNLCKNNNWGKFPIHTDLEFSLLRAMELYKNHQTKTLKIALITSLIINLILTLLINV